MLQATLAGMHPCSQHLSQAAAPRYLTATCLVSRVATPAPHSWALQARYLSAIGVPSLARNSTLAPKVRHRSAVAAAAPEPVRRKAASAAPRGPSAEEGRKQMLHSVPVESFKIAGVSFEGRQELVQQLQAGKAEVSDFIRVAHMQSLGIQHASKWSSMALPPVG